MHSTTLFWEGSYASPCEGMFEASRPDEQGRIIVASYRAYDEELCLFRWKLHVTVPQSTSTVTNNQPNSHEGCSAQLTPLSVIPLLNPSEELITCLKWVSLKNEEHLMIGYSSGRIAFHTTKGSLLNSFHFQKDAVPIVQIDTHSFSNINIKDSNTIPDTLWVLFANSVVVLLKGEDVWQSLYEIRRNTLKHAMVQLSGRRETVSVSVFSSDSHPEFLEQILEKGDDAPPCVCVAAVGKQPYASLHYVSPTDLQKLSVSDNFDDSQQASANSEQEGGVLLRAVAFGWNWLAGDTHHENGVNQPSASPTVSAAQSQTPPPLPNQSVQVDVPWTMKVVDSSRVAQVCSSSPWNGGLVAVADHFGRVCLLDAHYDHVKYIWKGYRDACVGWLYNPTVPDRKSIVLYMPKRGILEVWDCSTFKRTFAALIGDQNKLLSINAQYLCYIKPSGEVVQLFTDHQKEVHSVPTVVNG